MRTEILGFALYTTAIGLAGALGWKLYGSTSNEWIEGVPPEPKQLVGIYEGLRKKAALRQPEDRAVSYGVSYQKWWEQVRTANWTGKEPEKPQEPENGRGPEPPPPPKFVPVGKVVSLVVVYAGGDETRVKVRYKDPNVKQPASEFETIPSAALPGQPADMGGSDIYQDLRPTDALYEPYQSYRFERIEVKTKLLAVFSHPSEDDPKKRVEESLSRDELIIGEDFAGYEERGETGSGGARPESRWKNPGETTRQVDDVWMISSSDHELLQNQSERILSEEIGVRDFVFDYRNPRTGRKVKIKGVSVTRVSKRFARFGVQAGDILIKVNGKPVSSRASAIKVGRRFYDRGVRSFELTFLDRNAREVVRVYRVPDK